MIVLGFRFESIAKCKYFARTKPILKAYDSGDIEPFWEFLYGSTDKFERGGYRVFLLDSADAFNS